MGTSSSPGDGAPEVVEVAVLGSARIGSEDPRYADAVRLGSLLAAEGWTVVTGGYGGLMGAVAGGVSAAGGHAVGLPMTAWTHLTPDPGHAELRWSEDYAQRLGFLLRTRVAIALPGGVGTLAEAAGVWAAAQTEPGTARLVLVGDGWARLLDAFARELVVDERDLGVAVHVQDVDAVVPAVRALIERPTSVLGARG